MIDADIRRLLEEMQLQITSSLAKLSGVSVQLDEASARGDALLERWLVLTAERDKLQEERDTLKARVEQLEDEAQCEICDDHPSFILTEEEAEDMDVPAGTVSPSVCLKCWGELSQECIDLKARVKSLEDEVKRTAGEEHVE